ncbi:MAG: vWA domain-containing protein [Planctomycetaceae bacterium]
MLPLISVLLILLVAMTMFTVDIAYMQLTRTELRAATDAAAKAGAESLRRTQSESQARVAVKSISSQNRVAGQPLLIQDSEIAFGGALLQSDGSWEFEENQSPTTAIRVSTQMGGTSANPPVALFFAKVFGNGTFEPARSSVAAHTATEICLCLDRSHSMCFDLSGVDWSYPPGTPMSPHPVAYKPHPTLSRWGVLMKATKDFVKILKDQDPRPRVSLVTWGSEITSADYESRLTGLTFPAVSLDLGLSSNHGQIISSLMSRGNRPILGGTNMSAGINQGLQVLLGPDVNPLAKRILVLMSDGQWNQGTDPRLLAETAKQNHITMHTISFLALNANSTLEEIADLSGGRFYSASNEEQLRGAFSEIARQLPVVLID